MWPAPRPMAARAFVLRPPRWAPAALGVAAVLHRRQPVRCASLYPETEAKTGKLKTKDETYELYYEVGGWCLAPVS